MKHAIDKLGGTTAVARMVGLAPPSVTNWRITGIPLERAVQLEQLSFGRVTVEEMRPDLKWVRVPDRRKWPHHPDGRPLLDASPTK